MKDCITPDEAHALFLEAFYSREDKSKASELLKEYKHVLSIKNFNNKED